MIEQHFQLHYADAHLNDWELITTIKMNGQDLKGFLAKWRETMDNNYLDNLPDKRLLEVFFRREI